MLTEVVLNPLTLYGVTKNGIQMNLGRFNMLDITKRGETIQEILENAIASEWVIFGNTVFKAEDFSAFRVE